MPKDGTPLVYIYLDRDGIESLYAQITKGIEIELVESRSREGRGQVGLRASFGNLLTSLLGIKELGANTEIEAVHGYVEAAKTKLTVEHKLERLTEYLTKTKRCFGSLDEAASNSSKGEMAYVNAVEKFNAPDFYSGQRNVRAINESGAIVFNVDKNYDSSDGYFKKGTFSFVMTAGLRNFTRIAGGMAFKSHEAIMFSGFRGENIPLGVFGYVMRYSDLACQVKPYAMWLVTNYFPGR
jgi:hypothetical protein